MKKTCVVFGSSMGNTEEAANLIASKLNISDVFNVSEINAAQLNEYEALIVGSSTWGSGDLQDDWDSFDFDALEVGGKTVALFGLGDSAGYSDSFCDALGILHEKFTQKGANIVGQVDTSEYNFDNSRAVIDGKFTGLALDMDNESDKTNSRVESWVKIIAPSLD